MSQLSTGGRIKRGAKVFFLFLLAVVVILFLLVNMANASRVYYFWSTAETSTSIVILVSMFVGAAIAWSAMAIRKMIHRR
jgi:uncharacterized integral membrane protein